MRTEPKTRRSAAALLPGLLFLLVSPHAWGAIKTPRVAHTASLLPSGDVLIAGGSNYLTAGALQSAELFLSASGPDYFDLGAAAMTVARASHTATVLTNGKVLLAGGRDGTAAGVNNTAEIYDPELRTFTAVVGTMVRRFNHTATLLNNGTVLLCGGQGVGAGFAALSSCDYYAPNGVTTPAGALCGAANGCLSVGPSMTVARAMHTATLLKDGKVWIAGGYGISGTYNWLSTSEKYNPTTNAFGSAANLTEARGMHTAVHRPGQRGKTPLDGRREIVGVGRMVVGFDTLHAAPARIVEMDADEN